MRLAHLGLCLWAAAATGQTQLHHSTPQPSQQTLSLAVKALVLRFDAETAGDRAHFVALSSVNGVAANLAARVEVDQNLRRAFPDLAAANLSEADRNAAGVAIWQRIAPIDAANTAYLKSVLPSDGWFRNSRDGKQVTSDAWLIVQHSPDQALQREVVARMALLIDSKEVSGPDYALLYDRTELAVGHQQRYGSQIGCRSGHREPVDLFDPAHVDERRAQVGLGPMAEYMKLFAGAC